MGSQELDATEQLNTHTHTHTRKHTCIHMHTVSIKPALLHFHRWQMLSPHFFHHMFVIKHTDGKKIQYLLRISMVLNILDSDREVVQSCLTLCNLMDSTQPSSSVHGIFQARTLEWVAISFSNAWMPWPPPDPTGPSGTRIRGSSDPGPPDGELDLVVFFHSHRF